MKHLLLAILVTLALVACSDSPSSSDEDAPSPTPAPTISFDANTYVERGPHGVGVTSATFVDNSRPTAPNGDFAGTPERTIEVEIWYPAALGVEPESRDVPPALGEAPYPLIVFAHGFTAFARQSATFAQHLASRGYVVAAPTFPGSNIAAPGGPRLSAVLDQPADVSFVLDELLARNEDAGWPLAGAMDEERIGMAGHSLGGLTTMLAVYGDLRDERIDAGLPIAPVACVIPSSYADGDEPKPVMFVGATLDRFVGPGAARDGYEKVPAPKYLVDIEGADHTRFGDFDIADTQLGTVIAGLSEGQSRSDFEGVVDQLGEGHTCEDDGADLPDPASPEGAVIAGSRQRELLRIAGAAFFDAYLRDDVEAIAFLQEGVPRIEGVRYYSDFAE